MEGYKRILTGEMVEVNSPSPPPTKVAKEGDKPPKASSGGATRYSDPRPDLPDGELYEDLLFLAMANDTKASTPGRLLGALHGMRCAGTALTQTDKGTFRLRPILGKDAWASEEAYKEACKRYLDPLRSDILATLESLKLQARAKWHKHPWQSN